MSKTASTSDIIQLLQEYEKKNAEETEVEIPSIDEKSIWG